MNIPAIVDAAGVISAIVGGRNYQIPPTHKFYGEIKAALRGENAAEFIRLADVVEAVTAFMEGRVKVEDGVVYYDYSTPSAYTGDTRDIADPDYKPLSNDITERIVGMIKHGFNFTSMLKFLNNLMENPSWNSVQQLYQFLEHGKLPITSDGCFLGYKRVNNNWKDYRTQTVDNSIGATPEMPRNMVDDNAANECSGGFHVGTLGYINGFYNEDDDSHVIIVKVNPKDAVSVPSHDTTKLRVCKYEVVEEFKGELTESLVYSDKAVPVSPDEEDEVEKECYDCGRILSETETDICQSCIEDEEEAEAEDNFDDYDEEDEDEEEDDFDDEGNPL